MRGSVLTQPLEGNSPISEQAVRSAGLRMGQSPAMFRVPASNPLTGSRIEQDLHGNCLPIENKGLVPLTVQTQTTDCTDTIGKNGTDCTDSSDEQPTDCTLTVVDSVADCPELEGWRKTNDGPPMPRSFSAVPHLKWTDEIVEMTKDGLEIVSQTVTGFQIQWSVPCDKCRKRYRPVVGFVRPRAWRKMERQNVNEQQQAIETLIGGRFSSGRVNRRHPACAS